MIDLKECLRLHKLWLQDDKEGTRAYLSDANLSHANLSGADLSRANLSRANLSDANLSDANLFRANLSGAYLSGAYLSDANLSRAYLSGTYLSDANLSRANLSETLLSEKVFLSFMYKKHTAYFFGLDEITIGCHKKSISVWLTSFTEIGKKEGYTEEEIKMYGKFIKQCAKTFNRSNK